MQNRQFVFCVVWLVASAACLIVGAVVGMIRSRQLAAHIASLEAKSA